MGIYRIHSETVLDFKMQLLGLLLLLLRDLPEATPSRAQRGTKEDFCLVLSQLPHENEKEREPL